jgi:hypothetical protein
MGRSLNRRLAIVGFLSLLPTFLLAQHDTLWTRTLFGTGNGPDEVVALTSDPDGSIYAVIRGLYNETTAAITVKYSPAGDRLWWRRQAHADPVGIAVDQSSNVFIAGTGPGPTGLTNMMAAKYSPSGDSLWATYYDTLNWTGVAAAIQLDNSGDIYVSGTAFTHAGMPYCALVKYSNYGQFQWKTFFSTYTTDWDMIAAAVYDPAGYIYQVGTGRGKCLVVEYNLNGGVERWRIDGGAGSHYLTSCALDIHGGLLACGESDFRSDSSGILSVKYGPGDSMPLAWLRMIGGRANDPNRAVAIADDGVGNAVVAGVYYDSSSFSHNCLLVKYAQDGSELWRAWGPDTAFLTYNYPGSMVIAPDRSIYVTSSYSASLPPWGILTVKYSTDGESLWTRLYAGDVDENQPLRAVRVPTGICVGSTVTLHEDLQDIVVQYGSDGTEAWARSLNCSTTRGTGTVFDVAFDPDGNIVAVGYLDETSEFREFAVAKYSPQGDLLWLRTTHGHPGSYIDRATDVRIDLDGDIYVTGYTRSDSTSDDFITAKYDASGNLLWSRIYDGPVHGEDRPAALAVDGHGNVSVTGKSASGPGGGDYDYATVKYSATGVELWARRYSGGADTSYDSPNAIAVDSAGAFYVTGRTTESDRLIKGTTVKYGEDGTQIWVSHYVNGGPYPRFEAYDIALDADGGARVCGTIPEYFVIVGLQPDGETAWVRGVPLQTVENVSVAVSPAGGFIMAGGLYEADSCVVIAVDSSGQELWRSSQAGSEVDDIAFGSDGNVYLVARIQLDAFTTMVSAYDSSGRFRWYDSCSGHTYAIAAGPSGQVAVGGSSRQGGFRTMLYAPRLSLAEQGDIASPELGLILSAQPTVFSNSVRFCVHCAPERFVTLRIFDGAGRAVKTLYNGTASQGQLSYAWDGCDDRGHRVSNGVYFARAVAEPRAGTMRSSVSTVVKVMRVVR